MKNKYTMPIFVCFVLTLILLLSPLGSYSGTLEEELKAHIEYEFEAWSNKDIDKIVSLGYAVGFGFRRSKYSHLPVRHE